LSGRESLEPGYKRKRRLRSFSAMKRKGGKVVGQKGYGVVMQGGITGEGFEVRDGRRLTDSRGMGGTKKTKSTGG